MSEHKISLSADRPVAGLIGLMAVMAQRCETDIILGFGEGESEREGSDE